MISILDADERRLLGCLIKMIGQDRQDKKEIKKLSCKSCLKIIGFIPH